MDGSSGRGLIGALADAVTSADPAQAALVLARLAQLSGPGWLRLDERVRRPFYAQSPLDEITDWRALLSTGGATARVIAASMCRDGRVREAAVAVLARAPGSVAAAALAVRSADWVPEVSSAAEAAVSARSGPQDAAAIIPVLLAVRRRRGRQAADRYLARLADGPPGRLEALASSGDRSVRLWALQALAARDLPAAGVLAAWAMRDPDPAVALWCARRLAAPSGQLPPETGVQLTGSARAGVRAFAAGQASDDELTRPVLQRLLLDRSGAVRSVARWRWRHRFGDPGPVYHAVLAGGAWPRQLAAALRGLDEDRDISLPGAAVPFLAHPSPAVRCAAAQAFGRHASPADIVRELVPLLPDSSAKVSAAALRHLRGYALPAGLLAGLDAAGTARSRRTALSIRQRLGTWDRVHADLTAINGQHPDLAEAARTDLLAWLRHGAATSYGRPGPGQAAEIATLLATSKLTGEQRREIAFVAGIRPPPPDR